MTRAKSLKNKLKDPELLKKSWRSVYSGKSDSQRRMSMGVDGISLKEFHDKTEENLQKILNMLSSSKYKLGKLKGIPIPKESGDLRLITSSNVSDRIIHKAILVLIYDSLLPYIDTKVSYCGVKESPLQTEEKIKEFGTKKAIKKIIKHAENGNFFIFKTDIKSFYDCIPKRKFFNLFKKLSFSHLKDDTLNEFVKKIIFFKIGNPDEFNTENKKKLLPKLYYGISQGSQLSQLFANIYLARFDNKMYELYGDKFIRYVDDFIIMCGSKDEAKIAKLKSSKFLSKMGLLLSPDQKKTYTIDLRSGTLKFLGLKIDKNFISSKKDPKKWIDKTLRYGEAESMNHKIAGQENFLKHYHPYDFFKVVNKTIKHKRREKGYNNLESLRESKIKSLITINDWQALFK